MKMFVDQDADCVVIAFGGRGQSVGLSPEQARQVARALFDHADAARGWAEAGGRGKLLLDGNRHTKYGVQAKDEKVWLHFERPTDREVMPFAAAKNLARAIIHAIQLLGLRP